MKMKNFKKQRAEELLNKEKVNIQMLKEFQPPKIIKKIEIMSFDHK